MPVHALARRPGTDRTPCTLVNASQETIVSRAAKTTQEIREAVVIGSGPSGYTAAIYLARAGLRPLVLEGATTAGGALMNTTDVENYPGFPDGIMGPALMDDLRAQAERFGAELVPDDATDVDLAGEVKTVRSSTDTHHTRTVVLAMGSAYRALGVPGEDRLAGRGVSWCATCDGFFFRDQHVVVVGGGDSALEEATFLTRFASKVTLVHRRDRLRASKVMQDRAFGNDKIEFVWDTEVLEAVEGTGSRACGCATSRRASRTRSTRPACSSPSATTRAPTSSRDR